MGTHVDYKFSRIERPDRGNVRLLARIYEGAFRAATSEELALGQSSKVYERERGLREITVEFPNGTTDDEMRAYMNGRLARFTTFLPISAQVVGIVSDVAPSPLSVATRTIA